MASLGDDFFRLAHHDTTGRPLLHPRATSLGLAAALLAELVREQKIYIRQGHLHPWQPTPPADALAHSVLDQILAQPLHTQVSTWLGFLAVNAYADVAGRLWKAGHVRPETQRRLLRPAQTTYVPTDLLTAAGPWLTLAGILRRGDGVSWEQGFLLCLATATGLHTHLLRDLPPSSGNHLTRLCEAAPAEIRELTAITATAVGDAVLSYRT